MEGARRKRITRITVLSLLGVGAIVFMAALDDVFGPLLFALLLAYILNPVVNWIQRMRIPRAPAIGLLFLAFYACLVGFLLLTVPAFVAQVGNFYGEVIGEQSYWTVEGDAHAEDLVRMQAPKDNVAAYLDKDGNGVYETGRPDLPRERRDVGLTRKQAEAFEPNEWDRLIWLEPPWEGWVQWYVDSDGDGRYRPGYARRLAAWLQRAKDRLGSATKSETFQTGLEEIRRSVVGSSTAALNAALKAASSAIYNLFGFLTVFILIPIYLFYFLLGLSSLRDRVFALLPGRHRERILKILGRIDEAVSAFFRGRLIIMVIKGLITAVALFLLGVPFALVLGVITGVGSLIPIAGFLMGIVPAVLIALLDSGSIGLAVVVVGLFLAIEVFENYFLGPWILKDRVGLHPIALIVSVFVGGAIFGFVGMLLAVPTAAVLKILYQEFVLPEIQVLAAEEPEGS